MRRLAELLEAVESETPYGGQVMSYVEHGWLWLELGPRRRRERSDAGQARIVETMTAGARVDPRVVEDRILRVGGADWTVVAIEDGERSGRAKLLLERGPMSDHEGALQKAMIAWLRGDETLQALLGDPVRIWDQAPGGAACPHLVTGQSRSRAVGADGCGIEHEISLLCVSRFGGSEEAKAVSAAVRVRLHDAVLEADGVRTVSLRVAFADVFRTSDLRRTHAVIRVRAVTEEF